MLAECRDLSRGCSFTSFFRARTSTRFSVKTIYSFARMPASVEFFENATVLLSRSVAPPTIYTRSFNLRAPNTWRGSSRSSKAIRDGFVFRNCIHPGGLKVLNGRSPRPDGRHPSLRARSHLFDQFRQRPSTDRLDQIRVAPGRDCSFPAK